MTETTLEANIPIRMQVKGMTRQTHGGNTALESLFCGWATEFSRTLGWCKAPLDKSHYLVV